MKSKFQFCWWTETFPKVSSFAERSRRRQCAETVSNRKSWTREARIKARVVARSDTRADLWAKPIHLTLNPLKCPGARNAVKVLFSDKNLTNMPRFAEEWRRSTVSHPRATLEPPLPVFVRSKYSPLFSARPFSPPRERVASKGWLLNYLDRTKRNKWRWIGPLMRYWPITGTHVYWYVALGPTHSSSNVFLVSRDFCANAQIRFVSLFR